MNTGIKFFIDLVNVEYDQLLAAFSFYSGYQGNNIIYPEMWSGSNSATGYLNKTVGSFYANGSGFFDGSTFMSLSGQNFSLTNDSTFFISYQKLRAGNEILLSSATGSNFNNYQGYCLGVNDANKLYFKYWNPVEGAFTFTYSKTLSDKNLIVLNRTESIISIGRYNNNDFLYDLEEFKIFENAFQNNNFGSLIIGGHPGNIDWVNNGIENFSGYIDKFYFFNNIPFNYRNTITSGFYAVATGYEGFFENICTETGFYSYSGFSYSGQTGVFVSGFSSGITGVTGYITGLSGYSYSGITGYSEKYIGTFFDNCGNSQDIYEQIPISGLISGNTLFTRALTGTSFITGSIEIILSGLISGSGLVVTSGEICDSIFNLTGDALFNIDSGYLSNLSYSEISLLSQIKNNSTLEIYYSPYKYENLEYNVDTELDVVENNFYSPNYSLDNKNILLFAQGQALSQSGYKLIRSGYESFIQPNIDYFLTGNRIEVNKNFNESNQLFYDFYKDRINYNAVLTDNYNSGQRVLFEENAPNSGLEKAFIFRNGQKLLSGIDYDIIPLVGVAGAFLTFNGQQRQRIALLNNNGIIDNNLGFSGFNGIVRKFLLDGDKFLVVGQFATFSGVPVNKIQRISQDGIIDQSFTGSINNNNIYTLVKYKNKYLIGGDFTGVNNIVQNRISRLNLDGSVDTSFIGPNSGFNSTVSTIAVDSNNNIYVGGAFTGYNDIQISRLAKLDENGILDTGFNQNIFNNAINIIYLYHDGLLVGGNFTTTNSSGQYRYLAKLNYNNGNVITQFNGTGFNGGGVFAFDTDNENNILVGGAFTSINTDTGIVSTPRFVVLTPSGTINYNKYNPAVGFNSTVLRILRQKDGKLLFGGNFSTFKGLSYLRSIRLNSDYTVDNTFIPIGSGFNSSIYDFISYDAIKLNISGDGTNIFMFKDYPLDFNYISGSDGSFIIPEKYNNESSVIFFNGIRQKLNNNYIENSQFDLISGYFYESDYSKDPIYDNTNDFFV